MYGSDYETALDELYNHAHMYENPWVNKIKWPVNVASHTSSAEITKFDNDKFIFKIYQ